MILQRFSPVCVWGSLFFLLTACASDRGARTSFGGGAEAAPKVSASVADEIAVGQEIHSQIITGFQVYTKPEVVQYVEKIGRSLLSRVSRKELPYQFTILYNEKIYATSAPGGFIYLTTGMLAFLDSEAELAAVLAHEIGQLQYQDPRFSHFKKNVEELTRAGSSVAPAFGSFGALAMLGLMMLNASLEQGVKTPEERLRAADDAAFEYLLSAGYDPQAVMDVIGKFLRAEKKITPYFYDYYQARPITQERYAHLAAGFQGLDLTGKTLRTDPENYDEIMKPVFEIAEF
ncbi:MAG: M48 family metalloprotease [Candidatus Omnitrophota bacterium]